MSSAVIPAPPWLVVCSPSSSASRAITVAAAAIRPNNKMAISTIRLFIRLSPLATGQFGLA